MWAMFKNSEFNQPIGSWNVSNVKDMESMFQKSKFDKPIGDWNVSTVDDIWSMFQESEFKSELPKHRNTLIDFVDTTRLEITPNQLQNSIKIPLKQWCEENWDMIIVNELYTNIIPHYIYDLMEDEEKKFNLISKHNLTQFEI